MEREIDRRMFLRRAGLLGVAAWAGPGLLRKLELLGDGASLGGAATEGLWLPPFSEGGPSFRPQTAEESARYATAVSVAALPDGRVLYWNGLEGSEGVQGAAILNGAEWGGESRARILDLRSGAPRWRVPTPEEGGGGDMFCSDQKNLPDGRVVIVGGTEWVHDYEVGPVGLTELLGRRNTRLFDPSTNAFSQAQAMEKRRWYPSLVTLPDGRLLALSGVSKLLWNSSQFGQHGSEASEPLPENVVEPEVFDPVSGTWRIVEDPAGHRSLPLYPRVHLLPNGKVLYTGAGQMWGPAGESYNQLTWNFQGLFDPESETWEDLGLATYGARSGAFSALLPLRPPYDSATVLVGGGTLGTSPGAYVATDLSALVSFGADGAPTRAEGPSLSAPRWFSSPVLLPDGTVAIFSGGDVDHVVDPGSERAVRLAELYDPATNAFRPLSEGARERTYHNSAALLADGSVLVGGHSPLPSHYGPHGPSGVPGAASNFKDPSFELYRPPYLFRGARPRIEKAPRTLDRGEDEKIHTPDEARIESAVLIRLPAATHTVDADQRAVFLEIGERKAGKWLRVRVPQSGAVLPPGAYYLFLNAFSELGPVPSIAATVGVE